MVIFVDHNFSTVDHIKVGRGRDQNTFQSRMWGGGWCEGGGGSGDGGGGGGEVTELKL